MLASWGARCAGQRVITHLIKLRHVNPPREGLPRACMYASKDEAAPPPAGAAKKKGRRRLDEVCLERHPEYSRNVIQSWIAQGKVFVDDRPVTKAGAQVPAAATVDVRAEVPRYVCRAGLKLEAALERFGVDPRGLAALDAGLSTGGFSDCLLQRGAASVVGVDVGYGQVADRVRTDPRVTVMERTNLRHLALAELPGGAAVDLVTLDLSFISVLKVLGAVRGVLSPGGQLVVLIKPQFEAGKAQVSAGGVVRDPAVHAEVIARVVAACEAAGLACRGWMESPIKGATAGNTEFLAHFVCRGEGYAAAPEGGGGSGGAAAAAPGGAAGAAQEPGESAPPERLPEGP